MSGPTVSIVIPTYNTGVMLDATLESVLAQTISDWELILIDDGSIDGTPARSAAFAATDPRIHCAQQPNGGIARARNAGYARTSRGTHYIAFLDHDDVWRPEFLEATLASLESVRTLAGAHCLAEAIDSGGAPADDGWLCRLGRDRRSVASGRPALLPLDAPTTFACLAYRCTITTMGQGIIRRSALERAGLFDPDAVPADDWDMWLRLAATGDIGFVDRPLIGWRRHAGNASGARRGMEAATLRVRRKLARMASLDAARRMEAQRGARHDALDKFAYAKSDLRAGKLVGALRQTVRGIRALARIRGIAAQTGELP